MKEKLQKNPEGRTPKKHSLANTVRGLMATVLIASATSMPAWACNQSSKDTLPEPTPRSATGTPIPDGIPTLVLETPTPVPPTRSASITPEASETPKPPEYEYVEFDNIRVTIDKDGLPVSFILPKGEKFSLEREKMQQLREIAIQKGEPEVIAVTPSTLTPNRAIKIMRDLGDYGYKAEDSFQHPALSELPKDVLSEEELAERGIRIIQANTSLHIRQTAFEEDELLSNFNSTSGEKLTIVLINAPTVSKVFMDDPRYDGVRDLIDDETDQQDWIESTMSSEITFFKKVIDRNRERIQQLVDLNREMSDQEKQEIEEAVDNILILKATVHAFDNDTFTGKELLMYVLSNSGPDVVNTQDDEGNPVIFLPVGDIDLSPFHQNVLFFDPNGDFKIKPELITPPLIGIFPSASQSPKDGQSYPDPEDLQFNPSSPFVPPGVSLRLELSKVLNADIGKAMKEIRKAWDKWVESRYTNNGGYHFVFSLTEGGYIITKHESASDSSASSKV